MLLKPDTCRGCPLFEKPHGKNWGFSIPVGTGKNGVMVVAEALGKDEEQEGMALVGKSGYTLFQQLKRIDIERDDFTLFNVLACRPPDNKLVKMPYEAAAIAHCRPNLDKAIEDAKAIAKANGKTFVIVTLGVTPFKRVLGLDYKKDSELLKKDYYAYPFWSDTYQCWVLNAPHPAYLLRGNTHLWPVVQFVFKRALEIADNSLLLDEPDYLLDPTPTGFDNWIDGYTRSLGLDPDNPLSYDIETPYKKKLKDEEEIGKEEDADHTILRISFAYFDGLETHTVSIKWSAEYLAGIEKVFNLANYVLGWNSDKYDYPRVSRHVQIRGVGLDGMVAWHILNSSLPKALGFVTPYYWQKTIMWKHLSEKEPAFYNAKDADAALRNWIGIKKDLIANGLYKVYERHWIELAKALKFMSGKGVLRDNEMRDLAEKQLQTTLDQIESRMEEAVPIEARDLKIYKKEPKNKEGLLVLNRDYPIDCCPTCGLERPNKWKKHQTLCGENETTQILAPQVVWGKPLEFKVSKKRMSSYQSSLKHQAVLDRKENKVTFNADALTILIKKYPNDPLYPRILEHRKTQKLLSTYVGITLPNGRMHGGMPVGKDGRIHTVYGRDASTLRFTSEDPNLQNLPRPNPKDPNDPANIIRNLVVAQPGHVLYARDFSGIEAVLTGYFALDPRYIRLAKRDVHTYYTVYALYELEGGARIKAADLPDLDWSDDRLFPHLEALKKEFKAERNNLYKHLVHAANFMQGAKGAQAKIFSETGIEYPVRTVQKVMDVYYSLFPKIKQWHKNVLDEAEKDGYLRNPFDYVHRFNRPYDYKKEFGEWVKKPGPDANKVIAFKPQSTAVGIITEAILRIYFERFEEAGTFLRLQVHDELLFEILRNEWERVDKVVQEEMEKPVPQMRLPASWGMGEYLNILTEAKADLNQPSRWGSMKGL
jgi:uracil-DNA glycosylase family 4